MREGDMTFAQLQSELMEWAHYNFPDAPAHHPLLGAVEELGELAHAHLKGEAGIRGSRSMHDAEARDAVADTIIFLTHYCIKRGWDLQGMMETTWGVVRQRDWINNPKDGGDPIPALLKKWAHVLIVMHGDFTLFEWSERLEVDTSVVTEAFRQLSLPSPRLT